MLRKGRPDTAHDALDVLRARQIADQNSVSLHHDRHVSHTQGGDDGSFRGPYQTPFGIFQYVLAEIAFAGGGD